VQQIEHIESCFKGATLIKPLFLKGPSLGSRMLVLTALAVFIGFASYRIGWLQDFKSRMAVVAEPVYQLANIPAEMGEWFASRFRTTDSIRLDNERLLAENLLLKGKVQRLASLEAENTRLRQLLNSSALVGNTVLIAELVGVAPDPARQIVVISKGSEDGVYLGQPVLDAEGLFGQVIDISANQSRVMLITDSTHAVPVQVNRNGVRAIAEGTGLMDTLVLSNLVVTTDIKVGDLLMSSGLGGGFPAGYPVATVVEVTPDPGQPFLVVKARPTAQLDRSRQLLLVYPLRSNSVRPEMP
jgi:rod shape-determining protein MreC